MRSAIARSFVALAAAFVVAGTMPRLTAQAPAALGTPEQFFGFRIGSDNKLARWDKIVDYMRQVSAASDRVRFRELGKSTDGNPFIVM